MDDPKKRMSVFVVITYALAWIWWVPMALKGAHTRPGQGWPTHLPGLMAPSIAAFIVLALSDGRAGVTSLLQQCVRWRADWRAYGLISLFAFLAFVPVLSGQSTIDQLSRYSGAPHSGVWVIVLVLLVNGFGEEIGWRGFMAHNLLTGHSLPMTAFMVAVVWGAWHVPLFFVVESYRDMGPLGIVGWLCGLYFGSVFLTWLYQFTAQSVFVVVLWHVAYNFAVATDAAKGIAPASVTMVMMVIVVVVMRRTYADHVAK